METDATGVAEIAYKKNTSLEVDVALEEGDGVAATATDPDNNTSEFSPYVPVEEE